jgi:hypothetical protein
MTPPTTPALPPLPEPPNRFAINITNTGQRLDYTAQDMRDYALAALRQAMGAAPESAKPVAWRWRSRDSSMRWGDWHYGDSQPEHVANRGVEVEALYAAPSNTDSVNSGLALTEGEPGATKLLRRLDDALRTAWDARTLPACVIPADLAQEVGAFLRQARDTLGETARSNEKTPASGSSTAVSGEEARDAARYRGMRATLIGGDMHNFARMIALVACFFDSSDKFDAAIDSALQASNGLAAPSGSGSEGEGVKEVPRG